MSETLTIFGIDYPDTEGFKVKDDLGTTHTYGEGGGSTNDYPTFTITFDSDWEEVQSVTCDKTLNECINIFNLNDGMCPAFTIATDGTVEYAGMAWGYEATNADITFAILPDFSFDIFYTGLQITTSIPFPSGYPDSVTIRQNGNYDPSDFDYRPIWGINVSVPSTAPTLQTITKTYTPTESQQTEAVSADTGYDGLDTVNVTVGAISSTYVGTGIARKSSSDLTTSGATVTAPAGYYESAATKTVASGTEGTPTATKGTVSNHSISVTPSVTNSAGYIAGGTKTGTAVSVSASELDSGTKSITSNGTGIDVVGYASVDVSVSTPSPTLQNKTATPTESVQTITPDTGYDGLSSVEVGAISSTYVGSGIPRRTPDDLYGLYDYGQYAVYVPGGYYSNSESYKSVPNGTAGTPTATKGSVSNHSVSVTPSVTNTAGYITSGTKTGTAVSVSASELVSGSETKTANGTYDVTNLASLVVAIPFSTITVSSSNPTGGNNGDVWIKTS